MYKTNQWDKPLYLQTVMGKYLKLIGLLVLALFLWQTPGGAALGNAASRNTALSDMTLSNAALKAPILSNAALSGSSLSNAALNTPVLSNAVLSAPSLSNAVLNTPVLSDVALSTPSLTNATLTTLVLSDAALTNSNATSTTPPLSNPASDDTTVSNSVSTGDAADIQATAIRHQDEACFTSPRLPYLPVAELTSNTGHIQSLVMSRVQRSYIAEYIFSLKDWVAKLAQREAVLSLHKEKLFDVTAYCRCRPACEYYIFTLRRILI